MRPFDTVDMLFGQVCCRSECGCEPARCLTHYRYRTLTDGFGNLDFASIKETTDIHGSQLDADLGNVACIFTFRASGVDPASRRAYERVVSRVFSALKTSPFLLGAHFSAADILVASPFQ